MSVIKTEASAWSAIGTDAAFPSKPWANRTVRFIAHQGASAVVITAHGELDASNASQLADYVQRCATCCERLILDLGDLDFFGTAGFSTLHKINVRCARTDVHWAVVPSRAVSRLLRICDPDRMLPITESVAAVHGEPRRLLQLVSQPR